MNSDNWIKRSLSEPSVSEQIIVYGHSSYCPTGIYMAIYDKITDSWEETVYGSLLKFKYWMSLPDYPDSSSDESEEGF